MELGNHQSYLLRPVHKQDLIELVVLSNPKIPHEEEIAAISITNELISDVKTFIDELMKEIMTSAVKKFPVKCYFPCPQCNGFHVAVEKVIQTSSVFCTTANQYVDMPEYHKLLASSKLPYSQSNYSL